MKNLETRIARLEQMAGVGADPLTVVIMKFCGAIKGKPTAEAELLGYETICWHGEQPIRTLRRPRESDDQLLERAEAAVRTDGGVIVLHEIRQ